MGHCVTGFPVDATGAVIWAEKADSEAAVSSLAGAYIIKTIIDIGVSPAGI